MLGSDPQAAPQHRDVQSNHPHRRRFHLGHARRILRAFGTDSGPSAAPFTHRHAARSFAKTMIPDAPGDIRWPSASTYPLAYTLCSTSSSNIWVTTLALR